jgi:hypothetical protein
MLKTTSKTIIELNDWDNLIKETYGKPYSFQQQDGCKDKGMVTITVPSDDWAPDLPTKIPFELNGNVMGIDFQTWVNTDPKDHDKHFEYQFGTELFWQRNFYPDLISLTDDLLGKGLIEKGTYFINIDW